MKHRSVSFVLIAFILSTGSSHAVETITRTVPTKPNPREFNDQPMVVPAIAPEAPQPGDAYPADLQGALIVFDLRRLDLYRAHPDGTHLGRIHVDMSDSESHALNAASGTAAGVSGGVIGVGAISMASSSGFFAGPTAGAWFAGAGATLVVAPIIGISQLVKVLKRHGRVVRSITQVQPLATLSRSGDRVLRCAKVKETVGASRLRLADLGGADGTTTSGDRRFECGGVAPDFSPDGRSAVFVAPPAKHRASEIYRIDLASGTWHQLTRDGAGKTFPRWSPDNTRIAYQEVVASADDVTLQIFLMPCGGGPSTQVTHDELGAVTPSWSPDGTTIIYASLFDGAVHSIHPDGSGDVALTAGGEMKLHPQVSPGGAYVMYLQSSVAATGLEPADEKQAGKKEKTKLGEDFQLRLLRLSDRHEWAVPLTYGDSVGADVVDKTNLFWFQWCRLPVGV